MALTPKEREKIIEEETLRFETRQNLHAKACAQHPRRGRWLWWLGAGLLAYALWCLIACGGGRSCLHGGGMHGKSCQHGAMMDDDAGGKWKAPSKKSEE